MSSYRSFAESYVGGLREVLEEGHDVPSVRDPLSKASGFGQGDRPYRELIGYQTRIEDPTSSLAVTPDLPLNLSYCFGLLAWSLDGRNDVGTPAYYRRGAHEYSDDQHTLSGAFGHRLITANGNQLEEVVGRIERDPAHRRAFALVLEPQDNFRQSREYPCAVGVHLFLRDGALTWLTVMRAQQALTVLPYDAFLFMGMHQFAASLLGVPAGPYIHQAGTFHFYDNEVPLARKIVDSPATEAVLPAFPATADGGREVARELIDFELRLRQAAEAGDTAVVDEIAAHKANTEFADVARACLATHAYRKLGDTTSLVTSPAARGAVADLIAAI
ncbi:thymidylate synthase [Streptomyces sp. SL13]|uniref:Thymidylate synthase n=1 Tax=Streptantibioticus silvisoli TaxID=2705255 RepID=A0AA90KBP1_9ACTN|nr:thymidylate synthase [Streptantibioticus silvisoli]MDI5966023.1 thymidylate synthase [Streptantibioticus silvisoli]MDI5973587.1 thymidylate synthase [Streptantibioticus silvisoli]